jgi:DNA-binding IclR family transcriptional regulator
MRMGSDILSLAAPKMRALAESERINVGLAAPDRDEMVYLESIRYNRRVALRNVVSGQRVPMELTSLGRAYLATLPAARRNALFAIFRRGQ